MSSFISPVRRQTANLMIWAVIAVAAANSAYAQVAIRVNFDFQHYARYERINAQVTLQNFTGNNLVFTDEPEKGGYLSFTILNRQGREIGAYEQNLNPVAGLILGQGETKQLTLTLNAYYPMQDTGSYSVQARISHRRLRYDFISDPVIITVKDGITLWKQKIGIPVDDSVGKIPDRTITLLALNQERGSLVCLRVEDDDMVYGLERLGPRIDGAEPQCEIDPICNIHILFPLRPRLFVYRVYDYNLRILQNQHYVTESEMPRLVRDSDMGRVRVVGGRMAREGDDYVVNPDLVDRAGAIRQQQQRAAAEAAAPAPPPAKSPRRRLWPF